MAFRWLYNVCNIRTMYDVYRTIVQSRMSRLVIGANVSKWPGFIELMRIIL